MPSAPLIILARLFALLDVGRRPDRVERLVEAQARIDVARKFIRLGDDCLQRCANEGVAMRLTARQGACIAAQEGQVRCEFLTKRHKFELSRRERRTL